MNTSLRPITVARAFRRGFDTKQIAEMYQVKESVVANKLPAGLLELRSLENVRRAAGRME